MLGPLGILGGTFDPLHIAHLRMAQEAYEQLGLASVRFIPAGQPRHRDQPGASAEHRLGMARAALQGIAHFSLDDAEVRSDAPSYTVPTLERLRKELGADISLVLLLGADAFLGLASWHRWQDLFDLAHIAVATRPGYVIDPKEMPAALAREFSARHAVAGDLSASPAGSVLPYTMTPLEISATAIRACCAAHRSPRFLVPDAVLDYISTHQLYV